jgi:hypothetical protein
MKSEQFVPVTHTAIQDIVVSNQPQIAWGLLIRYALIFACLT